MTEVASPLARSALAAHAHKGRHGLGSGVAGVTARERSNVAIASIAARKGRIGELRAKIKGRTGLDLPSTPRLVATGHLSFAWAAPGQWFAMADGEDGGAFAAELAQDLAGLASVTDQSDGRVIVRVSGARVLETLAKGCMLDLHPAVFKVGDTATTPIALLNVQITRLPDEVGAAAFELAIMRSFAVDMWHWLESSAAEFGFEAG